MILDIVKYPNKILISPAEEVVDFDENLEELSNNMLETMKAARGIGLAANQIGVLKRVFVMRLDRAGAANSPPLPEYYTLVNPKVVNKEGEYLEREGCLSFPNVFEFIERSQKVTVQYQDTKGNAHEKVFVGLAAVCVQHEIDHLDGITFLHRMSRLKRGIALKQMQKSKGVQ